MSIIFDTHYLIRRYRLHICAYLPKRYAASLPVLTGNVLLRTVYTSVLNGTTRSKSFRTYTHTLPMTYDPIRIHCR
jgi:hypothetical protein